jgi:putative peptidoglycan lipid II flippase
MQFPLGLFGVAIATASAPVLARMVAQKQTQNFQATLRQSLQMSLFLSLPSTVGLFVLASPIISLIFEHGRFNADDTAQTSLALMAYSLGIAGYSLIKIYQPAFLAYHDSRTPMKISLLSILLNAALNWIFVVKYRWGHGGLALSTSIVATLNLIFLAVFFRKWLAGIWHRELVLDLCKCLVASVAMATVVFLVHPSLQQWLPDKNILSQILLVVLPILLAAPLYLLLAALLRISAATALIQKLRQART